jgi:hypothetical protein
VTKVQKACRFVSVLAAMLACAWLLGSFAMLDQGEHRHPIGSAIIWSGRFGAIGFAIAVGLAAVSPKAALKTMWASALAATPLAAFFLYPSLWCLFLFCARDSDRFFFDTPALIFFAAQAVALGGMHLSKPQ